MSFKFSDASLYVLFSHLLYLIFEHTLDFITHGFSAGIAEMDTHLVGSLCRFSLPARGASSGALAEVVSAGCMVRVSSLMALLSPGGAAPSSKKSVVFTVHNVLRRQFGCTRIFLPEVLPVKENRGTPFQDTVIDTGMGQVRRVL